jgi:hypothetical protein
MMDPFNFFAKVISSPTSVCAACAITGLTFFLCHWFGIPLFTAQDAVSYQGVIIASVFGASAVVIAIAKCAAKKITKFLNDRGDHKKQKNHALKNMQFTYVEHIDVLNYLFANKIRRFPASSDSTVLQQMVKAYLLKIDDPEYSYFSAHTYYAVPNYVWDEVARLLPHWNRAVPCDPPWNASHGPHGWMQ